MAISSILSGPVRSISLPSRLEPQPNFQKIESILQNLKSFSSKTAPFGLEMIQNALVGLAELYNFVWEIVESSSSQQILLHHQVVEEELNESVVLIDSCSTARDIILMMKESIQILQSALRRKGADSSVQCQIRAYFSLRRKAKKDVQKCLSSLKQMENYKPIIHDSSTLIRLIREARAVGVCIFGQLLGLLSEPVAKTRSGRWSLISQLMPVMLSVTEKRRKMIKEVESADAALVSLLSHLRSNSSDGKVEVQMAQRRLEIMAASFDGIEGRLDSIFRCLVKHRVCFLNILAS